MYTKNNPVFFSIAQMGETPQPKTFQLKVSGPSFFGWKKAMFVHKSSSWTAVFS